MSFPWSLFSFIGCLIFPCLVQSIQGLEPYGCEEDWINFEDHCYKIIIAESTADRAKNECQALGADLTSVWSQDEKDFLVSLWQFPKYLLGFLWVGLRGTPENSWEFDDLSSLSHASARTWSLLKDVIGVPASTDNKCVALRPSSTLAFLDCSLDASASVCKKALPKVYITPDVANRTQLPAPLPPLSRAQMFQRMYPPRLTSFPSMDTRLAEIDVDDEVSCAYKCFSINTCMTFQVSCHTKSRCTSYKCVLFAHSAEFL